MAAGIPHNNVVNSITSPRVHCVPESRALPSMLPKKSITLTLYFISTERRVGIYRMKQVNLWHAANTYAAWGELYAAWGECTIISTSCLLMTLDVESIPSTNYIRTPKEFLSPQQGESSACVWDLGLEDSLQSVHRLVFAFLWDRFEAGFLGFIVIPLDSECEVCSHRPFRKLTGLKCPQKCHQDGSFIPARCIPCHTSEYARNFSINPGEYIIPIKL